MVISGYRCRRVMRFKCVVVCEVLAESVTRATLLHVRCRRLPPCKQSVKWNSGVLAAWYERDVTSRADAAWP